MKLQEIRKGIDKIDRELLVLLQERMGLALRSKKFKQTIADPEREKDMFDRVDRMNLDLIERSFHRQLLRTIIDEDGVDRTIDLLHNLPSIPDFHFDEVGQSGFSEIPFCLFCTLRIDLNGD